MDDKPTEITSADIDKFLKSLMESEIKYSLCFSCSKSFFPNYDLMECDECYFSRFPPQQVTEFYKKIIDEML